jgi:hypothetical protein
MGNPEERKVEMRKRYGKYGKKAFPPYFPYLFTIQLSSKFSISFHNFLPYFPYLFTIQLTFPPYFPYLS